MQKPKTNLAKHTLAMFALLMTFLTAILFSACNKEEKEIVLSAVNSATSVAVGNTLELQTSSKMKDFDEEKVTYQIIDGEDFATLNSNILAPKSNAKSGNVVKIQSSYDKIKSNILSISIIGIPMETLTISANKTYIPAGSYADLSAVYTPNNATDIDFTYTITHGSTYASIADNKLIVSETATPNALIKVKAVGENIESNELTFTVSTISNQQIFISMDNALTLDNGSSSALPTLTANVYDMSQGTPQNYAGADVDWTITSGDEFITINPNGYTCSFTVKGHGQAVVRASLNNGQYATTTITAINPPEQIAMPEMLQDRTTGTNAITYNVGNSSPINFVATAKGTKVCQEINYTFKKFSNNEWISESTNGEFGAFNDNQITFNTTGLIKVIATSNSQSQLNISSEQIFNVNDGVNISTFDDLKAYMEGGYAQSNATNKRVVNFVVTEKLGDYGYSLVPSIILNDNMTNQTLLTTRKASIGATGDWTIYGNNHAIDMSRLKILNTIDNTTSLNPALRIWGSETSNDIDYNVSIRDLIMIGNCPVDATVNWKENKSSAVHTRAIQLGNDGINSAGKLDLQNINITKFSVGLNIQRAVDSYVKDVKITNCLSNGIESVANLITFENLYFDACGAVGIEVTPDHSNTAGYNFDQPQSVEFKGTINANKNNGNTLYFQQLKLENYTIPQIIQSILVGYIDTNDINSTIIYPASCAYFDNNELNMDYVALLFKDPTTNKGNVSKITGFDLPSKTLTQIVEELKTSLGSGTDPNTAINNTINEVYAVYSDCNLNLFSLRTEMATLMADSSNSAIKDYIPQLAQIAVVCAKFIDLNLLVESYDLGSMILDNCLYDFATRENGVVTEIDVEALTTYLTTFGETLTGLIS